MENQKLFISNSEYRAIDAVSNSELLMIKQNPADYEWSKTAPEDPAKVATKDFGTALHTALLEPEKFASDVFVSSVAGRNTKTFEKEVTDNSDKTVITEVEAERIRIMQASALCHPTLRNFLTIEGDRESSIVVYDAEFGCWLKIRPDIDASAKYGFVGDLKSTDLISNWREPVEWRNPLFTYGYGHTAAFYLYVASLFYGREIETYKFGLCQKTINLGKYPCSVFTITKSELIELGFWGDMLNNLSVYSERKKSGDWFYEESFPMFGRDTMQIEFSEE